MREGLRDVNPQESSGEKIPSAELPPVTDEVLISYAKGRFLMSALGLRWTYYRLLREKSDRDVQAASTVTRSLKPGDPELLLDRIRDSTLRVGGYQIWGDVQKGDEIVDRAVAFVIVAVLSSTLGETLFYVDGSFWRRLLYAVVALLTALVVTAIGLVLSGARAPTSRMARTLSGLLGLGALTGAAWWLLRWQSVWGLGLSSGIFNAAAALFALGLLRQIGNALVEAAYRISWSRWTTDEIIQTLAGTHWNLLNVPEPDCFPIASHYLEHVAGCIERFLPRILTLTFTPTNSSSITQHTQREFAEIAARIRLLAKECLLPTATTRASVADKVANLLISAAQGRWGEWETSPVEEIERAARWRSWISGALRFGLGLLPLVLVTLGALYLYRTNPASPLLKAEVLAPVLVATLGFFTASLSSGFTSEKEKAGRRPKAFRVRGRS
ncbi:hypothetical protein [Amycolatopsis balhimycina]|uniref:hypothetical protein n=1 Tax=Amycolatopsis balhimycina TaxID=208443 RepID=UPI000F78B668|nr:hypothetical protein [Amycolatopsis balhimycina]